MGRIRSTKDAPRSQVSFLHLILCCSFPLLHIALQSGEAATQNFTIAGLDSLSPNPLRLTAYGGMQAYVAYMPDTPGDQLTSAWLLFIPAINSSFILASLVFNSQSTEVQMGAIVWMANRQRPVSRNFSLSLDQSSGNLILLDGDGSLAWSSNVTSPPKGTISMDLVTVLSEPAPIGTLYLSDSDNATRWRSCDYPTHALAPIQFLQPGKSLVSWVSSPVDPSDGPYSLIMEAGGLALYYNGYIGGGSGLPYWMWSYYGRNDSIGVTHACQNLSNAFIDPDGGLLLGLSDQDAQDELKSSDLCTSGTSTSLKEVHFANYGTIRNDEITILSLQDDGNLLAHSIGSPWTQVFDLFSDDRCLLPDFCGPYGICSAPSNCECPWNSDGSFPSTFPSNNTSRGCPPTRPLQACDNNGNDGSVNQGFLRLEGVDYFPNKFSAASLALTSQEVCRDVCLQNCSCLAAFWHDHSKSCFHADGFLGSLQGSLNSTYIAFLKVEVLPGHSTLVIGLVSGAVGSAVLVVLVIALIVCYYRRMKAADEEVDAEDALWSHVPGLPRRFSYKEVQSITDNFSEQMGKGGFGAVYAGTLQDGTKVAVKRLEGLRQGAKEFRAEVVNLGRVHHYNLVELVGYCAEGSKHKLLVYEYMANGSLDRWLFSSKNQEKQPLPWKHRFNIALGAAKGLTYLHGECKNTVVHLDIKPENILLDDNFNAKVSDFGLSTLLGKDETHVITTMRGTPGYLAPEWLAVGSQISPKSDVFSFGKLLMELLGARKNLDPAASEKQYFPAWLYLRMTHEGGVQEAELMDIAGVQTLEEVKQAKLMMKAAFLCILENPDQRPSMDTVVRMLEGHVPELEHLNLLDLFQGLHFALGMPLPALANNRMEEVLAFIFDSSTSSRGSLKAGDTSQGGAHLICSSIFFSRRFSNLLEKVFFFE